MRPARHAGHGTAPRVRSSRVAVFVVLVALLALVVPVPAVAGPGSAITGIAWADTALDQTRPATGAIPKSGVTVQLVTPATNAVVATTITDASGRYTFANVADGSYNVLVTAPSFLKFPNALTGGSNRFVSTGTPASSTDPYQGVSQTVTIAGAAQVTNLDAGLQPIATLNAQPLAQPGYNCANGSGELVAQTDRGGCVTSTLSSVSQAFAVSVSNLGTGQTVNNLIATFTFTPQGGAVLTMPSFPQGCQTTGVTPSSSITGNLTLVCNLGAVNSAQIIAIKPIVVPSAASPNGSSFVTTMVARAGDGTAVTSNVATNPPITISGAPNYNTDKTVVSNAGAGTYTVNGQPQLGYQITYLIRGYPQTAVGSATLATPLTIPDAGIPQFPNAVVTGCTGPSVWYNQNLTPVQNCPINQTASAASPWNLTFTNYAPSGQQCVNLGGIVCFNTGTNNYATQLVVFVPAADVNRAANPAWQPGDPPPTGTVNFQNCLGNGVDGKRDAAGQLNNGNGVMGGQRCVSSSFAVAQSFPSPIQAFKRYEINGTSTTDGYFVGPGEPNVQAHLQYVNTASIPDPNFSMCDYFDVSTMLLTATNPVVTGNLPAGFRVEYGIAPNTIDVQVGPPATNATYPQDPVYAYSNTDQNTIGSNCSRYTGTWNTDPAAFGPDWRQRVNIVRIAPIPGFPTTPAAPAGTTVQFYLNFDVQSVYNGGPHAGQIIPNGAYIPNVGSWDRGPLDPSYSSQTAKVYYKQVLPKNVTGSKSYAYGNPSYGTGGVPDTGFSGNGRYTNAGATILAFVGYRNIGPSPDYDALICDYFDVSTLSLNSAGMTRPTNNGNGSLAIAVPTGFRIEYGVAPNTVNSQVGTPTVGNGYAAPVYQYSNAEQQAGALGCRTLDADFTPTPATAFGANWRDVVNVVRLAPIPGFMPTPQIPAGFFGYLTLNFAVRASYNGGPNAGAPIPQGANIPNVGSWDTPQNTAAPVTTQTATVSYLAYQLGLVKSVNTGVSYQPGSQVQWQITPRVTQGVAQRQISGVTITDVVPANTVFNAACTNASLPPGVTAALNLVTNTVTFTYSETYVVNATLPQNLPAVTMCTDILSTVNPGIQISNSARVTSNEAPAAVASNTSTIAVGGAGRLAISKSVSKPVISSGETYSWGLRWTNNSPVAFAAPQIIDVLPYNSDGSSGASSERLTGSSNFAGSNVLTGALAQPVYAAGSTSTGAAAGTWYYTTASPTSIEQNPGDPSNENPGTGSSIWVPAAAIADWSQVTGVFFSSSGFLNSGDTVTATIPMQANNGTQLGNIYVNQAELYSSSAPANPVVTNNPYTQIPGITILKQASSSSVSRAGDTVTYTFTVANQGRVSVANVSVADTQIAPSLAASLSPITCTSLTSPAAACSGTVLPLLAAGQTARFTATYTVTQADVDNGSISDTAVANAVTNPGGEPLTSSPSTALVSAPAAPAVDLVKTSLNGSVSSVGEVIAYNFRVTNTGNVTLHGVSVTDQQIAPAGPLTSGPTCPAGTVAPGAFVDCTATYTVRQADLDAGSVNDTATASALSPTNVRTTSPQRSASVPVAQSPSIDLVKSVTSPTGPVTAIGDVITYGFRVTNTGNVSVQNVTVTDQQAAPAGGLTSGPTCPAGTLAPGASMNCTGTYTVTQADLDAGAINDTATARADSPAGPVTSGQRTASVPVAQSPAVDLVKSVTAPAGPVTAVGDVVSYRFRVSNTGNVTLHGISVSDQQTPPAGPLTTGPTCPAATLAPGAFVDCTATYTVTQADLDNGSIEDTATAAGVSPSNGTVQSPHRSATVLVAQAASIDLTKSVTSPAGPVTEVGDVITYNFRVTNTGNVSVYDIGVADQQAPPAGELTSGPTCPAGVVAPGAFADCTATYAVTQADLDAGTIGDTAAANADSPAGRVISDERSVSVPVAQTSRISLVKSAEPAGAADYAAGQQVTYSFVVTNTGNTTLTGASVSEGDFTGSGSLSAVTCPPGVGTLAPGAQTTCTATYTITQADVERGRTDNTATAVADSPTGTVESEPSSVSLPSLPAPSIDLLKSVVSPAGPATTVGEVITYNFRVTNTGNVSVRGVTVSDQQIAPAGALTSGPTCPAGAVLPGAAVDCTATYTVTQADVDAGTINDTATAHADSPAGDEIASPERSVSVPVAQNPSIDLAKSVISPIGPITAIGDVITYNFRVTNTGNVAVENVTVADEQAAPAGPLTSGPTCPPGPLAPGSFVDCAGTYTVTQADLDAGTVADTATARADAPTGPVVSPPRTAVVPIVVTRAITLEKSADVQEIDHVGQLVTYSFLVANSGQVTLRDVGVTDDQTPPAGPLSEPVTCPVAVLSPGDSTTCTATYVVTQADIDHGRVDDTAVAQGTPPDDGGPVASASDTLSIVVTGQVPSISLDKSADTDEITTLGQVVTYSFAVTNTGDLTLTDVAVDDVQAPPAGSLDAVPVCEAVVLAPDESTTCMAKYTVTQADIDNGRVDDTATAYGSPPNGAVPVESTDGLSVPVTQQTASLSLAKSADTEEITRLGQVVSYSLQVTNTGTLSLTGIEVVDVQAAPAGDLDSAPVCPETTLLPGASTTCTAAYTVTQADLDEGRVSDRAIAFGTPPGAAPVQSEADELTIPVSAQTRSLSIVKTANASSLTGAGQVVVFDFTVTNTGTLTLTEVSVQDAQEFPEDVLSSPVQCPGTTLAPGSSMTCHAGMIVSPAAYQRGRIGDTATASAYGGVEGQTVDSGESSVRLQAPPMPPTPPAAPPVPAGGLPVTGLAAAPWVAFTLALGLLAGGTVLVGSRRRSRGRR
ncbi:putative repeat protein (TIGR01451 family) [Microbacterium sp. BK668]|nr:putative repeat protein (TIGR01451 family) [Microbacterium sp. BK668]